MVQTKILDEYPNYVIYSDGRIWSNTSNLFMSFATTSDGYKTTVLPDKNGVRRTVRVHRLVAMAFVPNPNNLPQVNHIDNDPSNNSAENLEWCTNQYNAMYGTHANFLLYPPQKVAMMNPSTNEIIQIFETISDAARFLGIPKAHSNISSCCNGKRKTAYGYKWEKIN